MTWLLVLVALTSSFTLQPYTFAFNRPPSKIEQLQEISALGNAGFIGEYWNSYILCAANPMQQNCTPYDRRGRIPCSPKPQNQRRLGSVRCPRCAKRAVRSETVYLVKNDWLNEFPEEIQQFRTCLVKAGDEKQVSGYTIAPYRKRG